MKEYIEREATTNFEKLLLIARESSEKDFLSRNDTKGCPTCAQDPLCVMCVRDNVIGNLLKAFVLNKEETDIIEVVRCGECVHSKERKIKDTVICSKYNAYKDVNGFCEAGEKKV